SGARTRRPAPAGPEKRPSGPGPDPRDQSAAQLPTAAASWAPFDVDQRSAKPRGPVGPPQRTVAKLSPFHPVLAVSLVFSSRCSWRSSDMSNSPKLPVRTDVHPVAAARSGKAGAVQPLLARYRSGWMTWAVDTGGRAYMELTAPQPPARHRPETKSSPVV